jgi:hypothetical protein
LTATELTRPLQAAIVAQEERLDAVKLVRTFEPLLKLVQGSQAAQGGTQGRHESMARGEHMF